MIVGFDDVDGWCYNGCNKDMKKVQEIDIDGVKKLRCEKCNDFVTDVSPKFKVKLRVIDETGSATFIIFEREMSRLLGKTALQIRQKQVNVYLS